MHKGMQTGVNGEVIAREYLEKKQYTILYTNWRIAGKEVDIVAAKGDTAIIVEVKTRGAGSWCYPEESVTKTKRQHLRTAGKYFLEAHPAYKYIRFDIIGIQLSGNTITEIMHFEEAFC